MTERFEPSPAAEPFDQEWYQRFEKIGSFQAYEYLDGDSTYRLEERRKFEAGEVENPVLDYPKLNPQDLQQKEDALLQLKKDVLATETSGANDPPKMEIVKQVYRWRLNEKIAEARLLQAAATGNTKRFQRYSKFIYGSPSPDVFSYTIQSLQKRMTEYARSDNPHLRQAALDLSAVLPNNVPEVSIAQLPDVETVRSAREATVAELGDLIAIPEGVGELDAEAMAQAFEGALTTLRAEGWKVVINPDKEDISVNQELKKADIGTNRRLPAEELKGLIIHEIGTHVARRVQGERSQLRLLGLGLDRYEGGEEGVATVREAVVAESIEDFSGLDSHLTIGLAQGLDGTPRDFRQVFDIMRKVLLVEELAKGKDVPSSKEEATKWAWNRCVRTFRGTDCKTPGAVFTKDIIYREGNIGVWELIRTNPEEMRRFNVGKYDPTSSRHLWALTELGITDQNLENLVQ